MQHCRSAAKPPAAGTLLVVCSSSNGGSPIEMKSSKVWLMYNCTKSSFAQIYKEYRALSYHLKHCVCWDRLCFV